ncbi:MAG: pyridoxal phosphate-dependent aminotransferase [Deltaproteobacteria bacterium]|nr:pyridoxal phosphate-dependent aminotransferase [Candidatus Anaeroferrophillus wilburensis]MBN2888202.1 pyridoxal phosphate-dependent aminotransferase [Deltaproteobacteria bacterium]
MKLASRVQQIKPSPTLAISAKAKALQAAGIDVINFGAGEPDFDTPDNVKAAGIEAIRSGFTRYTAVPGIPELKEAICRKLARENRLTYQSDEIIVSCGGKHSFYNLAQAMLDPGDEVIVPAPYWVSYPPMVQLAGGSAVIIPTTEADGFKITPAQLQQHISTKTRAVVINSPSNPTGSAYSWEELQELAAVIVKNDILVISDEIYEHIVYDGFNQRSIAEVGPQMKERTIILNGVSKSYAMTGWRIGFAAAPAPLVAAMTKIQSQSTSNPTSIAQKAALEAYDGPQDFIARVLPAFNERRDYIVATLNAIPGISCFNPAGAFYVFPRVEDLIGRTSAGRAITSSLDLCDLLIDEARIAAVPGEAFGAPGYLRLSYATSLENIKTGMKRLQEFVDRLED